VKNANEPPAPTTYPAFLVCTNCGATTSENVVRGITIAEHAAKARCASCGCKAMRPRWTKEWVR
jgi:hypothetical protein